MSKKIYSKPSLTVHGSVEKLTLGTGGNNSGDTIFNSFTGNEFTGEGGSDLCTIDSNGNLGQAGCPEGFIIP